MVRLKRDYSVVVNNRHIQINTKEDLLDYGEAPGTTRPKVILYSTIHECAFVAYWEDVLYENISD